MRVELPEKKNFVLPTRKLTKVWWKGTILTVLGKFILQPSILSKFVSFQRVMFISPPWKNEMFKVFNAGPLLAVLNPMIFFPTCFKISFLFKSGLHHVRTKNQNMFFQKPNLLYWTLRSSILDIERKQKNNHDTSTKRKNITAFWLKIILPTLNLHNSFWRSWCAVKPEFDTKVYFKIFGTLKITKENTAHGWRNLVFHWEKHHFGRKYQLSHLRGTVLITYPQKKCFAKSWQDKKV